MNFISEGSRRTAKVIESTVERSIDNLTNNLVVAEMIPSTRRKRLIDLLGNVYVPNLTGDIVRIPKEYRKSENVAVIGRKPGQRTVWSKSAMAMTPSQIERSREILDGLGLDTPTDDVLKLMKGGLSKIVPRASIFSPCSIARTISAVNSTKLPTDCIEKPSQSQIIQFGRPVVVLCLNEENQLPKSVEPALIHEMVHVGQTLNNPAVISPSSNLLERRASDELEAYGVDARYGWSLVCSGNPDYAFLEDDPKQKFAKQVDRTRCYYLGDTASPAEATSMAMEHMPAIFA